MANELSVHLPFWEIGGSAPMAHGIIRTGLFSVKMMRLSRIAGHCDGGKVMSAQSQVGTHPDMTLDVART